MATTIEQLIEMNKEAADVFMSVAATLEAAKYDNERLGASCARLHEKVVALDAENKNLRSEIGSLRAMLRSGGIIPSEADTATGYENDRLKEKIKMLEGANASLLVSRDIVRSIIAKLEECGRVREV